MFRRRRLAVLLLLAVLVLAAKVLTGAAGGEPQAVRPEGVELATSAQGGPDRDYVVKQGDTLWAIARQVQPDGDVRPVVDRLAALRRGAPLRVGERIVLP